jgi:ABC-type bacteriocin/lantibiotic exporter with double-glycine peptidase domain
MRLLQNTELRWLAVRVKPFLRLHLSSYFCILLSSFLVLLDPLIVRFLIDEVIPNQRVSWLPFVGIGFLFTYMARLGADNLAGMLNFRAVQKLIFRSRLSLLRHLQRLSAEYHDNRPLGDTLHRLQNDVDQVATLSGDVIPSALRMLTVFTLVMTTMLVLNYQLTIIVLPLVPVFILVRRQFHDRLRRASDSVQEQSGKVIGFLEEHLSSIVQVQLLSCEQREARRFARLSSGGKTPRHGTVLQRPALLHHHHRHGERALLRRLPRDVRAIDGGRTRRVLRLHVATLHSALRRRRYLFQAATRRGEYSPIDGDHRS